MANRFEQDDYLDQLDAVDIVSDAGGDEFLSTNDNGNLAIDRKVLEEFRALTADSAVWMKSAFAWRRFDPLTDTHGQREQPL